MTIKNLSLAALLIASAAFVACSGSDNDSIIDEPQPVNPTGQYTMTVKASKGDDAATRALTLSGSTLNASWAEGEKVKVYNASNQELGTLTATPDAEDNTKCTLSGTVTGTTLKTNDQLTLKFLSPSYSGQDGTLDYISENCDYAEATTTVTVNGNSITGSAADFINQQAIAKFTLVDKANTNEETNKLSTTHLTMTVDVPAATMTVLQNSNPTLYAALAFQLPVTYVLTMSADTYTTNGAGVLYLAIPDKLASLPDAKSLLTFALTATVGDDTYSYTKTGFPFENGKYYDITVKMAHTPKTYNLAEATGDITLKDGDTATGTLAGDYKVSIANGATVTLSGVTITNIPDDASHKWAGINCPGDATIVLASGTTNTVKGGDRMYPGIYIAPDKTLTIEGSGTLNARSNGNYPKGAGIGGGYDIACGNIVIKGGNITAAGGQGAAGIGGGFKGSTGDASWGDITISGGNITATGGQISTGTSGTIYGGAGIGSGGGKSYRCGQINITGGTINATGGQNAAGIGGGSNSSCGGITISGGTVDVYGGQNAVAIGTGVRVNSDGAPFCGNINITNGVTRVTATKGTDSSSTIGATSGGTRGKITIGGVEFAASITDSPYTYKP